MSRGSSTGVRPIVRAQNTTVAPATSNSPPPESVLAPAPGSAPRPGRVPSLSVIIAAYQAAEFVGEAVASALGQTLPPHEVIVCDDGSTDDIEGALAPYRDRIGFIRQENRGEGAAKNAAADAASGEFLSILDADDLYLDHRNDVVGRVLAERTDLDILTTNCYIEVDGEVVAMGDQNWRFVASEQRSTILRENFVFGNAAVRRSRFVEVGGFDEAIVGATDWDLWMRLLFTGSSAGAVRAPLARYRVRKESLSNDRSRMVEADLTALRKAASTLALTPGERAVLDDSLAAKRRALHVEEARESVIQRAPDARRRSLAVARGSDHALPTRAKAAIGAVAPGVARRLLLVRDRRSWIGPAGIRVPR